jgi:hypothetical protein
VANCSACSAETRQPPQEKANKVKNRRKKRDDRPRRKRGREDQNEVLEEGPAKEVAKLQQPLAEVVVEAGTAPLPVAS